MSEEPQPLSLSEVKILFSNELARRENRLRCIDCGHFQPVPEVEETPETPVSDSTDESDDDSEGPKGPTCDSCDSDRMMLNEHKTFAELDMKGKNQLSHRGKALNKLLEILSAIDI